MIGGLLRQVLGPLGGDDDERDRAVALLAAVEQVQRVDDHPRGLVVLDRDRLAVEERVRVGRRVSPVGDRDRAEVGRGGAVLVHVAARLHRHGGRGRAEPHRVGPGVVEAVGVDLGGRRERELAEARLRPLVEAAVADHDVGDPGRDRHRRLLHGRAGRATAVVDPAEEAQLRYAELAGHRDLRGGVHRERRQPVDVGGGQAAVGQRGPHRLDGELQLGSAGLLGELGRPDADDRRLAAEAHGATTRTVPVTWSPSDTRPTTAMVAIPSSTSVTSPLKVSVS